MVDDLISGFVEAYFKKGEAAAHQGVQNGMKKVIWDESIGEIGDGARIFWKIGWGVFRV